MNRLILCILVLLQVTMREEAQALHHSFLLDLMSTQDKWIHQMQNVASNDHQHHMEMIQSLKSKYEEVIARSEALEEGHKVAVLELVQQHKIAVEELKKVKEKYQHYEEVIAKLESQLAL